MGSTFSTEELFCCVPNTLIAYGCYKNSYLIPVYIFSAIHKQIHNNNLVQTTPGLIEQCLNQGKYEKSASIKIKHTLKTMKQGVKSYSYTGKNKAKIMEGFSPCIKYKEKQDNVGTNTYLSYYFNESEFVGNKFSIIKFKEYDKILNSCAEINKIRKKKLNPTIMLSLYCYIKMYNEFNLIGQYNYNLNLDTRNFIWGAKTTKEYVRILKKICEDEDIFDILKT